MIPTICFESHLHPKVNLVIKGLLLQILRTVILGNTFFSPIYYFPVISNDEVILFYLQTGFLTILFFFLILGTCIPEPGSVRGYRCTCPNHSYGRDKPVRYDANCALKNPCDSNPCQNDGYCLKKSNGKFTCACRAPYHGEFCEMGGSSNDSFG